MQVEVQLLKDVGTLLGVSVLRPVVGVDVNTWVVNVDSSTVEERWRDRERECQSLQQYTAGSAQSADLCTYLC